MRFLLKFTDFHLASSETPTLSSDWEAVPSWLVQGQHSAAFAQRLNM